VRLKEDNSSWRSGGIKRRDFRHDPGMPETEIPKQTGLKRNKKKHVHEYERVLIGTETVRGWYYGYRLSEPRVVDKFIYVCRKCGNKRSDHYHGYWT
jgi:hypothetical protein